MVLCLQKKEMDSIFEEREKNNCIYYDGNLISSGEFVLYNGGNEGDKLGYILDIKDKANISKLDRAACGIPRKALGTSKYALVREIQTRHGVANPDPQKYNLLPRNLPEAIPTANCCYIPVEEVKDVAFVFHIDQIQGGRCNPAGFNNAFFTKKCRNPSNRTCKLDAFNSFPNPKSFSKRVWDFASTAREEKRKALAAGGQWDGRCKSITLPGHNVGIYSYLSTRIADTEDGEVIVKSFKGTGRHQKVMNCDLSNENKRIRDLSYDLTRVVDEPGLKKLRMTLGSSFGVANPTPVPTMKAVKESHGRIKAKVPLKTDALVRIVTARTEDKDSDSRKEIAPVAAVSSTVVSDEPEEELKQLRIARHKQAKNCRYPGIDMVFTENELGKTGITFRSKFKKLIGDTDYVRNIAGYRTRSAAAAEAQNSTTNVVTDRDSEDESDPISVGNQFIYNGYLYQIDSVNNMESTVTCVRFVRPTEHPTITISLTEATYLVQEYA